MDRPNHVLSLNKRDTALAILLHSLVVSFSRSLFTASYLPNPMPMNNHHPHRPGQPAPLTRGADCAFIPLLRAANRIVFDFPACEALVTFQQFSDQSEVTFAGGAVTTIGCNANRQAIVVEPQRPLI